MRFKIISTLILLFVINQSHSFVTVGNISSGACNYTSLSQALGNGEDEIRLVTDDITDNLIINHSVTITGGYANCSLANNPITPVPTVNTFIYGTAVLGESVIKIILNSTNVNLNNLYITGGRQDVSVANGGHGIKIEGTSGFVSVRDSTIADNKSENGGGVYLFPGTDAKHVSLINTTIFANIAEVSASGNNGLGGGVYCRGTGGHVYIEGDSDISFNTAHNGGGIAAVHGCLVRVSSGIDVNSSSTRRGVMNNHANNNGGGVYTTNDALVIFDPTLSGGAFAIRNSSNHPATLANNTATVSGGGGYSAFGASLRVYDSLVHGNSANFGGGFNTTGMSHLVVDHSGLDCWNIGACSMISGNSSSRGGALFVTPSGSINESLIIHTVIKNNRSDVGTMLYISGASGITVNTLTVYNSLFHNNGNNGIGGFSDSNGISLQNNARLLLIGVTIADNDIADGSAIISNSSSSLSLRESIVYNTDQVYSESQPVELDASCLVVNENNSISASNIYVEKPGFVNAVTGDYHLRPDSFAIDLCMDFGGSRKDFDFDSTGIDITSVPDVEGPVDAGSDEYNDHEAVFKNGFE